MENFHFSDYPGKSTIANYQIDIANTHFLYGWSVHTRRQGRGETQLR